MKKFFLILLFFTSFNVFSALDTTYETMDEARNACLNFVPSVGSTLNLSFSEADPVGCRFSPFGVDGCDAPFVFENGWCSVEFTVNQSVPTDDTCGDGTPIPPGGCTDRDERNIDLPDDYRYPTTTPSDNPPVPNPPEPVIPTVDPDPDTNAKNIENAKTANFNNNITATNVNTKQLYNLSNDVSLNNELTNDNSKRLFENSVEMTNLRREIMNNAVVINSANKKLSDFLHVNSNSVKDNSTAVGGNTNALTGNTTALNNNTKALNDGDKDGSISKKLKDKFNDFKKSIFGKSYQFTTALDRPCPTFSFNVSSNSEGDLAYRLLNNVSISSHCQIMNKSRSAVSVLMTSVFLIIGFRIVFGA